MRFQEARLFLNRANATAKNTSPIPASASSLKDKVEAFQRSRGIEVNGRASPTTLILLKRATDAEEPRLAAITP